jgi:hypothetical protein
MAALTTETIEKAMTQLRERGLAKAAIRIDFLDRNGRQAGTLKPERLERSIKSAVLAEASRPGCWYAFGLSIMHGYHSVLLLVDRTKTIPTLLWLDQLNKFGLNDDVTLDLDQRITDKTQSFWQHVMDTKHKGYKTQVRLWLLGRPVPSYRPEPARGLLKLGVRGPRTQALQSALAAQGYFSDRADGHFGYYTDRAVREFQQARGLHDDGVAGRDTFGALRLKF